MPRKADALKAAIENTRRHQLDTLLAEESRWKRKQTIAENKLAAVRGRITTFAKAAVATLEEKQLV